jgi:hypothetical protein
MNETCEFAVPTQQERPSPISSKNTKSPHSVCIRSCATIDTSFRSDLLRTLVERRFCSAGFIMTIDGQLDRRIGFASTFWPPQPYHENAVRSPRLLLCSGLKQLDTAMPIKINTPRWIPVWLPTKDCDFDVLRLNFQQSG